jgi:hypothetical protein
MGFYPDVQIGEKFVPSAQRENDMRRFLNSLNGFSSASSRGRDIGARVKVYNDTNGELKAGTPVAFIDGDIVSGAIPVVEYTAGAENWGVLTETIDKGVFSSVIVSGPAQILLQGETGKFASPTEDGFVRSSTGSPILCNGEDSQAVILLGASAPAVAGDGYNGYFKVTPVEGEKMVRISGGETDCGYVEEGVLDLSDYNGYQEICLQVTFEPYDESDMASGGEYHLSYSTSDSVDTYNAYWLLATVEVWKTGVTVTQQWCSGKIFFGSTYWLP